jgi:hypothetical protein
MAIFGVGSLYVSNLREIRILIELLLWPVKIIERRKQANGSISVCIAVALRAYYSFVVNSSYDGTWLGFELWTWEAVEIDLGIVFACALAFKPLLLWWLPNFLDSVFGRSSRASRKVFTGRASTFVLLDSPNRTPRGKSGEI